MSSLHEGFFGSKLVAFFQRGGAKQPPAMEVRNNVEQPVLAKEPLDGTNSFAAFVIRNQESLGRFSHLDQALQEIDSTWRNSPVLEKFVSVPIDILARVRDADVWRRNVNTRVQRKAVKEARSTIEKRVFDHRKGVALTNFRIPDIDWYRKHMTAEERATIARWEQETGEFAASYSQAMEVFEQPLSETKRDLFDRLSEYLRETYVHVFDLREFLIDGKYSDVRESIRPFLISLAKEGGLFPQVHNDWITTLSQRPDETMLNSFVTQADSQAGSSRLIQFVVGTIRRAHQENNGGGQAMLAPEDVLALLPPMDEWPHDLQQAYKNFVSREFSNTFATIAKGLYGYRATPTRAPSSTIDKAFFHGEEREKKVKV